MKKYATALMILCGLILVITFISKSAHIRVNDFNAYYKTAVRAQHLETPYQTDGDEHPYKYPPLGIVIFLPFGLFSYNVAKIFYGVIELCCCFAIPILSWKILAQSKARPELADFKYGVFWSFLATLRFMDSEFQENQVGTLMATLILLGCWLLTSNEANRRSRNFFGVLCIGIGGLLKFYGVIAWGEFLKAKWKHYAIVGGAALALCVLLPNPLLWKTWWMQVHATGSLKHTAGDPILQGWFPLLQILRIAEGGTRPFFYFLPFLVALYFYLPKLGDLRKSPGSFTLSMLILFVVSVSLSPLPWQHSYSAAWALLPLVWMTLTPRLRRLFIASSLFLALSPKGIIGETSAHFLESHQSVYLTIAAFILMGAFGARHFARLELTK